MSDVVDLPKATRASSAYGILRDEIISATLRPGTRLQIRALCDRLDIGLTPMREALSRLSSEGLVAQEDHRGFTVAPLSESDLSGLTKARCWLNETGLRQSIAHGDLAWEEAIVLAFYRLKRTPRHIDDPHRRNPAWEAAHRHFHASMIAASGSEWLDKFCLQTFDASERYRNVARIGRDARPRDETDHEHLMEAVLSRDADEACRLMTMHITKTEDGVRKVLGMKPADRSKTA